MQHVISDMENVKQFTGTEFFLIHSFTQKPVNCAKIKIATKQRIAQIIQLYWHHYPHSSLVPFLTIFTLFFTINCSFTKTFLLKKNAQNFDKQLIFDKTVHFQSQDFTPALKLYTNSARDAHDIFHVCVISQG